MTISISDLNEYFAPITRGTGSGSDNDVQVSGIQSSGPSPNAPVGAVPVIISFWRYRQPQGLPKPFGGGDNLDYLSRIDMIYSDGTVQRLGMPESELSQVAQVKLQPGELIKSCKFHYWTFGETRDLPAGFTFTTSFDRTLDCTSQYSEGSTRQKRSVDVDVGSGLLLGAVGSGDACGRGLGLLFLREAHSMSLRVDRYITTPTEQRNPIKMVPYADRVFQNELGDAATEWKVSESIEDTESFEWSIGLTLGLQVETEVSGGFFGIVKAGSKVTWSAEISVTATKSYTTSKTISWEETGPTPPGKSVTVSLSYGKGLFETTYEGELSVVMKNGAEFKAPCAGKFKQTAVGVDMITSKYN